MSRPCLALVVTVTLASACAVDVRAPERRQIAPGRVDRPVDVPAPQGDSEQPSAPAPSAPETAPEVLPDDAAIVTAALPGSLICGEPAVVSVTVENRGSLAWTRDTHRLGAVNDSDPLFGPDPRVYLPDGVVVAAGERFSFEFTLEATDAGVVTTDWQMVHEGVQWFGEVISAQVVVECDEPAAPPPVVREPPNMRDSVRAVAAERPDLLAASCVDAGGNNEFLHLLVDRLRESDPRWGYNWKRGNIGDMSQDVVDYYDGAGDPQEDSSEVFIIDVIGGHCGDNPQPAWTDVTQATADGGTIGRWTSLNRF